MKHISGIPACVREAEKLGRGGKFASPGAREDLAAIQNQAAHAYHSHQQPKEEDDACSCSI